MPALTLIGLQRCFLPIDRPPERLAVADQSVDGIGIADLGAYPGLEQALKALHVELRQQHPATLPLG